MYLLKNIRILLPLVAAAVFAAGPVDAFAQTPAAFSQRGFGPRGIALGNAQVSDAFGYGSPWYNPALAPFYADQSIEVSYSFLSQDRALEYFQFVVPMQPRAGVAAGLIHAGVSDIDGRDASGYHTEFYNTDDFAGFLAFGSRVGTAASIGISFRFYRSDLLPDLDAASSIGISLGGIYRINETWSIGLGIDDLLSRYEWDTSGVFGTSGRKTTDDFPVTMRLGTSHLLLNRALTVSAEYETRFESARVTLSELQVIGGTPRLVETSEDRTLRSGRLRVGGEYRFAEIVLVRIIPTLGFSVEQNLGDLGATFDYVFGKEPYSVGTFHVIGIHLNI